MARRSLGAGLKVVLIDDSDIALDFQRMLLERYGFEVRCCGGLSEMIECLDDWSPHAVVTDVDLPDAVETDVVAAIRERTGESTAVILCSGLPLDDLEQLAAEKRVEGFVSKSENIRQLPEVIERLCSRKAL